MAASETGEMEVVVLVPYSRADIFKQSQFGTPTNEPRNAVRKWLKHCVGNEAKYLSLCRITNPWRHRTWKVGIQSGGEHAFLFLTKRQAALFKLRWGGSEIPPNKP